MVEPDLNIDDKTAFRDNIAAGVAVHTDQIPDEVKRMGGAAGAIREHIGTAPRTVRLAGGPLGRLAAARALAVTVADWVEWGDKRAGDVTAVGDATRVNGENWIESDATGERDFEGGS